MRYADNQPCKECRECIERAEAARCRGCEARTLQLFIRWASVAFVAVAVLFVCALRARADDIAVTSNVSTVKGWVREHLTYNEETGEFSRTNFPSYAETTARYTVATNLPVLYAEATTAMTNNLAPLRTRLDQQRARPTATIIVTAGPNAALDRQNLTFCIISNEVAYAADGLDISAWVFSSSILRSPPIMDCDLTTIDGTVYGGAWKWAGDGYGTNAVEITVNGEEYETYKATCHIATAHTNLSVYVSPWITCARKGTLFDFGNRRLRINKTYALTTNDLSWVGRFYTTNGVEITQGYTPYADRGLQFWTKKETEEEDEE